MIADFRGFGEGRLEAVHVAVVEGEAYRPVGQIRFGFAGKGLWDILDRLRAGSAERRILPVPPTLYAEVKFVGHNHSGAIRDCVLPSISTAATSVQ